MIRFILIFGCLLSLSVLSGCGSTPLSIENDGSLSQTKPKSEEQGQSDFSDDEESELESDKFVVETPKDEMIETVFVDEVVEEPSEAPLGRLLNIGESGRVDVDHQEVQIEFSRRYRNPVLFLLGSSWNGSDAARPQVKEVSERSAVVFIQESSNHDGPHMIENLSYLVLEAGLYELPNGESLEVGRSVVHSSVGKNISSKSFQRQDFATSFASDDVVVMTQLQTNDKGAFASVRMRHLSASGFEFALELDEAATEEYGRGEVAYLAVRPHAGESNRLLYEFGREDRSFSDQWGEVLFAHDYDQAPLFQAQVASYYGGNSVQVRHDGLDEWGVDLFLEEDQSWDDETRHTNESLTYFVIEAAGKIKAYAR